MPSKISELFTSLVNRNILSIENIHGCSQEDIFEIANDFAKNLPFEYIEFLKIAGRGAGKLFQGTDIYFPEIIGLNQDALDLLNEKNRAHLLPSNACAFSMHQGYEFNFFIPDCDDPAIFQYIEGNDFIDKPWGKFSDFVKFHIDATIKIWPNLDK